MSYYFVIVGTRDNPLYEAQLSSKPVATSSGSSFFSSSSSSSSSTTAASAALQQPPPPPPPGGSASSSWGAGDAGQGGGGAAGGGGGGGGAATEAGQPATGGGGVFGFGTALGALAGNLGSTLRDSASQAAAASSYGGGGGGVGGGASSGANAAASRRGLGFGRYDERHVLQMIAHSSLDAVEDRQFTNGAMYMKAVDRINEWTTSAFVIPGNVKFLILHEHKLDDGIRNFFLDVWELFLKVLLNPLHDLNSPIRSAAFDARVRASARKHL